MKNLKNILIVSFLTLTFTGLEIASADTFSQYYKSSNGGLVEVQASLGVDKSRYDDGSFMYVNTNLIVIRLRAPGGTWTYGNLFTGGNDIVFSRMQDFKIGKPGSYLTFNDANIQTSITPWAYFDKTGDVYLKNNSTPILNLVSRLNQENDTTYYACFGQGGCQLAEKADVISGGYVKYMNKIFGVYSNLWNAAVNEKNYEISLWESPSTSEAVSLIQETSSYRGVSAGTEVYESPSFPEVVRIPFGAHSGQYVAQATIALSFTEQPQAPTYNERGDWWLYDVIGSSKNKFQGFFGKAFSFFKNSFDMETANAEIIETPILLDDTYEYRDADTSGESSSSGDTSSPSSCSWWCNMTLSPMTIAVPFTVDGAAPNTSPSILVK